MVAHDGEPSVFPCKHDGCDEMVTYVPTVVLGALREAENRDRRARTIYLRCPRGHVHAYRVIG